MTSMAHARDAHAHLAGHRKRVVAGAVLAAAASLVPAPLVDAWAARFLRLRTIRGLAEARRVDLGEGAAEALVDAMGPVSTGAAWAGTIARRVLGRVARRVLLALGLVGQAREAARTFAALTLVDHYLARIHVGGPIEPTLARALGVAVRDAVEAERTGLLERLFRRALTRATRGAITLPLRVLDVATWGLLGKLWRGGVAAADQGAFGPSLGEASRASPAPDEVVAEAAAAGLGRVTRSIEVALARAGSGWQAELVDAFETAWHRSGEAREASPSEGPKAPRSEGS